MHRFSPAILPSHLRSEAEKFQYIQEIAKAGLDGCLPLRYAKIRSGVLYFVFAHPAHKQEWRLKKEQILERMRKYYKKHIEELKKNGVIFSKAEAIVIAEECLEPAKPPPLKVPERSDGNFENRAKDKELFQKIEELRLVIKERNEKGG